MVELINQTTKLISAAITPPSGLGLGHVLSGFSGDVSTAGPMAVDNIIHALLLVLFSIIGLILLIVIIIAGFTWMTSGGDQNKIEKSRKTITTAVIGIVIVVFAFFITDFLVKFFSLPIGFSFLSLFNSL